MPSTYDTIVIGAGPGGEVCAGVLGQAGQRVAIVERELVAGECSYWACMPTKTLLRPPEAWRVRGARRAPGGPSRATPTSRRRLAWRDRIVHDYDDAKQLPWLEERGIELLRGEGRIAGPGRVRVDDVEHTTDAIVLATGSLPLDPAGRRPAGLEGVWTNREATGMRGAAAPAGARRRPGRRRARADRAAAGRRGRARRGRRAPARREPQSVGEALARRSPTTASSCTSGRTRPRRPATGTTTCCGSRTGRSSAATACWSRPAAARASTAWAWRRSASSPASAASRSTSGCAPATASGPSAT